MSKLTKNQKIIRNFDRQQKIIVPDGENLELIIVLDEIQYSDRNREIFVTIECHSHSECQVVWYNKSFHQSSCKLDVHYILHDHAILSESIYLTDHDALEWKEHYQIGYAAKLNVTALFMRNQPSTLQYHSNIIHSADKGQSNVLIKAVHFDDQQTDCCGEIQIHPTVKDVSASYYNHHLVFAANPIIMAEPQLTIQSGEVECRHGVTISEMDAEALFYMMSRGLTIEQVQTLIVDSFCSPCLNHPSIKSLYYDMLPRRV
ncbi:MAG: hypothetical protein FJ161_00515 [Gammaproteobacteria bacterium]|nr:hypothetical protein [Gammaproteobacteria bacterium]